MPAPAAADWYFTPFVGWDVASNTTLADLEYIGANRTKMTFGGSAMLLIGIVGVEVDYAYVPRFSQNPDPEPGPLASNPPIRPPTLISSHVQTLTGNVIVAAPLAWTRESLRPYLVGGIGWLESVATDTTFPVSCNLTAVNLGGGAVGMLGNRAGLRFDLRRFRGIGRPSSSCPSVSSPRVNLWRATVGVTLRY
jgi:hypothetical protein